MAKRKVADRCVVWLRKIEKMTEEEREAIRGLVRVGVRLTVNNTGMLHAIRVFDQRCRILKEMPRHRGMKRV